MNRPKYVGVDDGHWGIKVVSEDGSMHLIPSRARIGRHLISWQDENNDGGFYQTEEGHTYTANENIGDPTDTRFKDYPRSELNRVLVHHALAEAGFGGEDVIIATGLPVSYYYQADGSRNQALIDAKAANLQKGVTCASRKLANIVQNFVTTEAIAAYFDRMIGLDGTPSEEYTELQGATVGIVDVGGKTTDSAVVYPGGQQIDTDRSGSSDYGVLMLNDAVLSRLRATFDLDNVPPRLVETAIRTGAIKLAGEPHDVTAMVLVEKEQIAEQIMSGVRTKIGTGKDLDTVLFVGGGAIVLRDQLARHFPHSKFPDRPEFANARGMLKIAKFILSED